MRRQISEVTECEVKRIGSLSFNLKFGTCGNSGDREIYLCFDFDEAKQCRYAVDPLGNFTEVEPTRFNHSESRIAASPSE